MNRFSVGVRRSGVAVLLFGLAFAIRCIPAPRVFAGGVHLFGNDAYYHLRRVLYHLERFPETLGFDRYINYPYGAEPIWPHTFDSLLALLAWPVYRGADPANAARVEAVLVFVPPLLGAATVVALYRLARRLTDEATAVVAGAILALLSGHYWYSQIGFVDHHAAVSLLSVLLVAAATRGLTPAAAPFSWRAAVGLGAAFALPVLVWPGALLHVLTSEAALFAFFATRDDRAEARRLAVACALANALAALATAPFGLASHWGTWSDYSPAVLTRFQPWLFSLLAANAAACAASWRGDWGVTRVGRLALAGTFLVALLALSLSFFPPLAQGALDAWQWLFKAEVFQAQVGESQPLFQGDGGGFDPLVANTRLSRFVYLVPFALGLMLVATRRAANRYALRLVALQTVVLFGVTLLQKRFFNSFSPMLALLMGWTLVWGYRRLAGRSRALALGVVAASSVWLMLPVLDSYRLPIHNVRQAMRSEPISLPTGLWTQRRFEEAAVWLRESSPPTAGFLDARLQPEYGVLAEWSWGHIIEYLARRPTIATNFGDDIGEANFLASRRYFDADADEAADIARRLGVRYVVLQTSAGAERERLPRESMRHRMSGSRQEIDRIFGVELVYDRPMRLRDGSRVRIFELR